MPRKQRCREMTAASLAQWFGPTNESTKQLRTYNRQIDLRKKRQFKHLENKRDGL